MPDGIILKFIVAFIVVLGLIGATFYLVRRFGSDRLGSSSGRGRQPRLAVIDAAAVDGRRRLILIRRDNVEHLLMIGGPSDVVVEANIVRNAASARDAAAPRPPAPADTLPRPVPLGEANMWPLQPVPEPAPAARSQRPPAFEEPVQWHAEPEPAPPPQRRPEPRPADPLAGLAAELSRQPAHPEPSPPPPRMRPPRERETTRDREMTRARAPQAEPMRAPAPPPAAEEPIAPNTDQNLAEMAQRLEAALRRPKSAEPRPGDAPARPAAMMAPEPPATAHEPMAEREGPMPPQAAQTAMRPAQKPAPQKSVYDSLEQEMASLLGRPNAKT